MLLLLRA